MQVGVGHLDVAHRALDELCFGENTQNTKIRGTRTHLKIEATPNFGPENKLLPVTSEGLA